MTLTLRRGETWRVILEWQTSDGTPLSLTGRTPTAQVRRSAESSAVLAVPGVVKDDAAGTVTVTLSSVQTGALTVGEVWLGVELADAATPPEVVALFADTLRVLPEAVL